MIVFTGFSVHADWLPFLAELAAKATLVLLLTAVVAALLWRSSAAVRHLVWCVGIVGVLALPVFSLLLPPWELPLLPVRPAAPPAVTALPPGTPADQAPAPQPAPSVTAPAPSAAASGAWLPGVAAGLAATGVAAGLLWLAVGIWGVARLGRRAEVVRDPEWLGAAHEAAARLGLRRAVLLLRSQGPVMPATGGILWPVIVVPAAADHWTEDRRRAVLAHELAHVQRFDCLTQALAQVACAFFWWHPAVWYAARRLRVERERACDDLVLQAGTRASEYATHLLEIARTHRGLRLATPALVSMARPSQLESRLLWVLDTARARGVPSHRAAAVTVLLALLAVGSLSAIRPTQALAVAVDVPRVAPAGAETAPAIRGTTDEEAARDVATIQAKELAGGAAEDEALLVASGVGTPYAPAPEVPRGEPDPAALPAAAGNDTIPSVEDLITMRSVGVDAAYIASWREAGYNGLTARQLIDLRSNGVSARYAREMSEAGLGRLTVAEVLSLHTNAVSPSFVTGMARHGYTGLTAARVRRLKTQGVSPGYVTALGQQGLTGLTLDQLTDLATRGITGQYVASLRETGITGFDADVVVRLSNLGVGARWIRSVAAEGLTGLSATQVADLAAARLDAQYLRNLRENGTGNPPAPRPRP